MADAFYAEEKNAETPGEWGSRVRLYTHNFSTFLVRPLMVANRLRHQERWARGGSTDCIAAHSPQGARRVPARIQAIIDLLLPYPLSALARAIHHPAHDI